MNIQLSEFHKKLYEEYVRYFWYLRVGLTTTIAVIHLHNGFEIVGSSSCLKPDEYDLEKGAKLALERALDELVKYLAYDQSKSVSTNNYFRIENVRSDEGDPKKFIEEVMKELEKSEWKVDL